MTQSDYEIILTNIKFGTPAIADRLIKSFNETVQLSNERVNEMQAEEKKKAEETLNKQRIEQIKQESSNSKVIKK